MNTLIHGEKEFMKIIAKLKLENKNLINNKYHVLSDQNSC